MIPRTFPSSRASNGSTQMIVYFLPSVSGLTRWVDYIPVKFTTVATAATENTYNQNGYIPVVSISSITGATPFKEYVPVFLDSSAADADVWDVTITGFIPVGTAGIGGAALYMDFAATTTLDSRVTFSRTTNATLTNSAGLVATAPMNLLTFSEQFDNAAWTKGGVTITANATASPDGTTTADRYVESALNEVHSISSISVTAASGATYTLSVYAKNAGRFLRLILPAGTFGVAVSANFDLVNGIAYDTAGSGAVIQSVGNGWYRCSICVTATTGATGTISVSSAATSSGTGSYTGDGISGIYLWGAQLELGSTATTYNPTTVKNLLGFTEHFDNAAWTKSNASISATKVDDIYGQPFAQKLVEDANNTTHFTRTAALTLGFPATFSCYMKAGERSWGYLQLSGSGSLAYFDLNSGVVGTTIGGTAEISSVGAGWYRCSLTDTTTTTAFAIIGVTNANGSLSYTGDGTSGIYIFGAQLSDSASVDPYVYQPVAAPSSVAYYAPRFDYDPVTLAPKGLLIEEQRTNLLTYSEQFDNAAWGKQGSSVSQNVVTSPDGSVDADKLIEDATTGEHRLAIPSSPLLVTAGTTFTLSVYAKAAERTLVRLSDDTGSAAWSALFNLANGTIAETGSGSTAKITPIGNGWYRCAVTYTTNSTLLRGRISLAVAGSGSNYTGDGTSGAYIWGAQLEAGAFATSYIPTVASQVTRAADSASMIGNNFARWYNQTEGTLYLESSAAGGVAGATFSFQNDAVPNDAIWVQSDTRSNGYDGAIRTASGFSAAFGYPLAEAAGTMSKRALAYKVNDFALSKNGTTALTDTAGSLPSALVRVQLGSASVATYTGAVTSGTIKRIAYYNRRLSNTELQGITS